MIDGAENNWPSYVTTNHFKAAPELHAHRTLDEPRSAGDFQEGLGQPSAEDKQIFRDAARDSNKYMREQWKALEDKSRRQAETAGNVIITS